MRESGPFQSKTRKRSNYMQVTILHGFSTYCSLRPKRVNYAGHSELFRDGRWIGKCLQHMENQCEAFCNLLVTSTYHHVLGCCVSVVFNENIFKLVVLMHKHFFSRERVSQFLIVALLSFRRAFFSSQKSFKIISFLASGLSFSFLLFICGHTCLISFLFLVFVFLLVAFIIILR